MLRQRHPRANPAPRRGRSAERTRVLLAVATLPLFAGYLAVAAVLAVIAALATQSVFSAGDVLLAAGPGWLAAHQVPLQLDGQSFGLLPLTLTALLGVLVARSAAGAAERLGYRTPQQAVVLIATMSATHAVVGVVVAILSSGGKVSADPLAAFLLPGLFAAVASAAGLARPCGLLTAARPYTDNAAVDGLRAGLLGLTGLVAAGAFVLAVASVFSAPQMHTLFMVSAPDAGSAFGVLVLCLAYLPNAVLGSLGFITGPGLTFGDLELGPFTYSGGDVPAVPLLAAMPDAPADWWRALFVLPAVVGVLVGLKLRRSSPDPRVRLRSAGVAGAVVGFGAVVLGALAGGELGAGGLHLPLGWLSLTAFCWIAVPAALVVYFAGERPQKAKPDPDTAESESDAAETEPEPNTDAAETESESDTDAAETDEPEPESDEPESESDAAEAEPEPEPDDDAAEPEPDDARQGI